MQFISSDTNVWIDFLTIRKTEIPFRLPYTYIMCNDAIDDELLSPPDLGKELISYGLVPVEFNEDEFELAEEYGKRFIKLSRYDRIALAIAKCRNIIPLTADNALRNAAKQENVPILGTPGIPDRLWENGLITREELTECLQSLLENNGGPVRLPKSEILSRLAKFTKPESHHVSSFSRMKRISFRK